ncbi:MAG: CDP-alcohol phosphatidyltransferase family protein [Candidatus Marinimicrobia bacterium]|nr:CDP-alcohol phosphatidyltransferase family protein [Candidatus Neomarinimicrobiota bacterium]
MKKLFREYKSSLKPLPIESIPDLFLFRPIAFILVKLLYYFPVTPNQVSVSAIIFGILGGVNFSKGTPGSFALAGMFYGIAHIMDCADGMLARIKKNGTPTGRIVDGLADYTIGIAIFTGLGIGLSKMSVNLPAPILLVILLAVVSTVIQCILVDYYSGQFLIHVLGDRKSISGEIAELTGELEKLRRQNCCYLQRLLIKFYLGYSAIQNKYSRKQRKYDPKRYYQVNKYLLRLWSMVGPAVNILILVISSFLFKPEIFLIYVIFIANGWIVLISIIQRVVNKKIEIV